MSVKNDSIEAQLQKLRKMAEWFEGEDFSLDEATEKYKQVTALASSISAQLQQVKNEVEVLKESFEVES